MKKLNQKGFTLLEVLIAIALLTLVAAAVYPLLSTGTQGIALAASQQKALYSSKQDVETELATAGETKVSTADVEVTLRDGSGAKLDSKLAPGNYYSSTDKKISTFKAGGDSLRITPSTQEDNKSIGDYALSIYGTTFETGKKFTLERVSANDNNKVLASYDEKTVSFVINSTSTATMTLKERIPVGWYKITYDNKLFTKLLIYSSEFQCKLMAVGDNGSYAIMDPLNGTDWTAGTVSVKSEGGVSRKVDLNDVTFSISQQMFYVAGDNGYILNMDKFDKWNASRMSDDYKNKNDYPNVTCITVDDQGKTVYAAANYEHKSGEEGLPHETISANKNDTPLIDSGKEYRMEPLLYDSNNSTWQQTGKWAEVTKIAYGDGVVAMSGKTNTAYDPKPSTATAVNRVTSYSGKNEWGTIIYRNKDGSFIRRIDESARLYDDQDPYWGLNRVSSLCYMPNFKPLSKDDTTGTIVGGFVISGGGKSVYNCVMGKPKDTESIGMITGHSLDSVKGAEPKGVACKTVDNIDMTLLVMANGAIGQFNTSTKNSWLNVETTYEYTDTTTGKTVKVSLPSSLGGRFNGTTINAMTCFEGNFYLVGTNGFIAYSAGVTSGNKIKWTVIDVRDAEGNPITTNFNAIYGYDAVVQGSK